MHIESARPTAARFWIPSEAARLVGMKIHADLRSDTITLPSEAMKHAMLEAELGDDVLGDEPTVLKLQDAVADLFGKEAACFVPSGTMANQAAIRAHTQPGDEIVTHRDNHIYLYESGAWAAISGCSIRLLDGAGGQFSAEDVEAAVQHKDAHFPNSALLVAENTHNRGGGTIWPMERTEAVTAMARRHGMRCHLDGARIWNACAATGIEPAEYARCFDTVSACFSKGLGCPVGSIVAGDRESIHRVHRIRKLLGGTMRQSGMLAAACLHAMEHNRARLADDHRRARRLADAIVDIPGLEPGPAPVETNIVYFDVPGEADGFSERLDAAGIRMFAVGPRTMRAVLNLMVDDDGIDRTIEVLRTLV